ncbi:hypothetical protein BP00DRAFT_62140 [Aspergillus indologenus CBS 114.80]|uniref:Uncharacterized protein n=1 Tax=Aspergillus indologenus CBS 114.80 TaxID=1450541 RepID=A0A2V5ID75_9EURO|nr:hypothetical protein BP00DRAFT_62140 [Aspergillus indologenus CBS 114.80]
MHSERVRDLVNGRVTRESSTCHDLIPSGLCNRLGASPAFPPFHLTNPGKLRSICLSVSVLSVLSPGCTVCTVQPYACGGIHLEDDGLAVAIEYPA